MPPWLTVYATQLEPFTRLNSRSTASLGKKKTTIDYHKFNKTKRTNPATNAANQRTVRAVMMRLFVLP